MENYIDNCPNISAGYEFSLPPHLKREGLAVFNGAGLSSVKNRQDFERPLLLKTLLHLLQ